MQSVPSIRPRHRSIEFLRLLTDAVAIAGAMGIAKRLSPGFFDHQAVVATMTAVIAFYLIGHVTSLYRVGFDMTSNQEVVRVTITWLFTLAVLGCLAFYTRYGQYFARSVILGWSILVPVTVCLLRMMWRVGAIPIAAGLGNSTCCNRWA